MASSIVSRAALGLALAACGNLAQAALDIGEPAPRFTANAALGGKTFRYSLADALAKGPV
ncbi:MAG: peroxiredoxin, partial [Comamonadaceae bacterium]